MNTPSYQYFVYILYSNLYSLLPIMIFIFLHLNSLQHNSCYYIIFAIILHTLEYFSIILYPAFSKFTYAESLQ